MRAFFASLLALGFVNAAQAQQAAGVPTSNLYQVTVTEGGAAAPKLVYLSRAALEQKPKQGNGWWDGEVGKTFSYSIFSVGGPATITVTKLGSHATAATIRPNRLGLGTLPASASANGSTVSFNVSGPTHLSVEFNDDAQLKDGMVVMAQPAETNMPNPGAPEVYVVNDATSPGLPVPAGKTIVYFPAGLHRIDHWTVPAQIAQVYFAEGSYVRGYLYSNQKGRGPILINGRGVLSGDIYPYHIGKIDHLLDVSQPNWGVSSAGNVIEGIGLVDSSFYTAQMNGNNSRVENVLFHGFQVQNDGLHLSGPNNLVRNNFFHVNDDNICTDSQTNHVMITNNMFWGLRAGSIFNLDYYVHDFGDVTIAHSDLIHADWSGDIDYPIGSFIDGLNMTGGKDSDKAVIHDITVSDLQVDTPITRLFDTRMVHPPANGKPAITQLATFRNFTFSDIHLDHQGTLSTTKPLLLFDAADATHNIFNFQFQNLTINGQKVTQNSPLLPTILQLKGPVNPPSFQ